MRRMMLPGGTATVTLVDDALHIGWEAAGQVGEVAFPHRLAFRAASALLAPPRVRRRLCARDGDLIVASDGEAVQVRWEPLADLPCEVVLPARAALRVAGVVLGMLDPPPCSKAHDHDKRRLKA